MSLIKNSVILGAANLVQKTVGMLRSVIIARYFGTGGYLDCFFVALIPVNLLKMVVGTSMAELLIPEYVKKKEQQKELFTALFLGGLIIGFLTFIFLFLSAPLVVDRIGAGFSPEKKLLSVKLLKALSVLVTAYISNNILRALAIAKGRFYLYSLSNFVGSALLLVVILFYPTYGEGVLPASLLIGEFAVMFLLIAFGLPQLRIRRGIMENVSVLKDKAGALLALVAIVGLERINPVVDSYFASHLGGGAIAILNYADSIYSSIMDVIAGATVSVLYPRISEIQDNGEFQEFLSRIINNVIFVFIPVTAFVIFFSKEIIILLYQRGNFTAEDSVATSGALSFYALGMIFYQIRLILARRFYAVNERKKVIYVTLLSIASNGLLNYILIRFFGLQGIAFSTSFVQVITCSIMLLMTGKEHLSYIGLIYFLKNIVVASALLFLVRSFIIDIVPGPFYNLAAGSAIFLSLWYFVCMKLSMVPDEISAFVRNSTIKVRRA
ncbi:MAG: polysaccharide biosynthesis C-terminal domain-containing protein [Alphaproteobacteria bacterium]|uniref:Polysaccharide biosynthesis C-terminal domain-containing protein n=1 Tax=Candidatus Nitrobium versatile TaxID=2884831 RepID=A0A953J3P4_9BACT|nr:polysaccharide biosynthesis C-terminal domain-containing protein [Candidatus Nitrobium versatile]